jgi:ADP-ribose pyrophosphatase YjhB (NUDIX family)
MFPTLPQSVQHELEQLAQRYGQPLVYTADLGANDLFDPLNKTDRYGEVCMVVRRKNGRLLTMTKTFYPKGAYRLPTGGINYGESIHDALLRETNEETGLQVNINRFLAAIAYRVPNVNPQPLFYTFAFLLDEVSGTLGAIDETERIEAFREIEPAELPEVAAFLEAVKNEYSDEIDGIWKDWGHFRAVIHRVVWEALEKWSSQSE